MLANKIIGEIPKARKIMNSVLNKKNASEIVVQSYTNLDNIEYMISKVEIDSDVYY